MVTFKKANDNESLLADKKSIITLIIAGFLVVVTVAGYWYKQDKDINQREFENGYTGIVDTVTYDLKGFPTISVNGKRQYLGMLYRKEKIEVGDSIIKIPRSEVCQLIKFRTKEVIYLNKEQ